MFVPALSGLACPHWDRRAAGLWLGLSLDTDRRDLIQSLLEGVALRAAEVIRAMGNMATTGERISIDGGMSVNPYFCQFLANALGQRVSVNSMSEVTALGTAMLAAGGELVLADNVLPRRDYLPDAEVSHYLERFSAAVSRCRDWRQ